MQKKRFVHILLFFLLMSPSVDAQSIVNDNTKIELANKEQRKLDYYFYEAMNSKSQNKIGETFDLLNYCYSIDSTNANVLYELGNYYSVLDNKNTAMNFFRNAVKYDSNNYYYRMAFAMLCLEFKQYDDAIEQYELLVDRFPDKTDLYLFLSEASRLSGDLPKAIQALDKLEQNIGLNDNISLQKYQLYSLLKQEDKAFAEIEKHIAKNPNDPKYLILLGNLHLRAGKTEEALKAYTAAKQIDPENPLLISSMAAYYEETNNKEAAEKELRNVITHPKMDVDTKMEIMAQYVGILNQNDKDIQIANVLFDTLLIQHPQEPNINMMYGNLLLMQNNRDQAYSQFKIFAEANPTNPTGWEQMLASSFPDSISNAKYACLQAIKYLPALPQFYFFLGMSFFVEKEYDESLKILKEGVALVDEENGRLRADFYGQMGDLYYQTQQTDSAFASYDKALKYNPNSMTVLNNYSYFLSVAGKDLDKAEKMSSLTIKAEPTNPTFLDTYGWILFKQGAYTMAKIYIEKALNYSEEKEKEVSGEVLEHYGDVLFKTGEEDKALEYWIKAQAADDYKSELLDKKVKTGVYSETLK